MRFGVIWEPNANAWYRAVDPMRAMERRGHEIRWPPMDGSGRPVMKQLKGCDVVHVYRLAAPDTQALLKELIRNGTAITYDNDDDFAALPKQSPTYKKLGGLMGHRIFTLSVGVARMARVFTTTSEILAARYRNAGVERVEVIPNHLAREFDRPRPGHAGIVIGWVAGGEHAVELAHIDLVGVLERLIKRYPEVRVETIGVKLPLSERYRHDKQVHFLALPERVGKFDIGIAPLADVAWNRSRSDIKVKEYAASGVPWLASPVGPYVDFGEREGGRLVSDDGWYDALERLITHGRERRRLARKGKAWAKHHTIDAVADRWEQLFLAAANSAENR
jgi:glycosyltransferase involved in cell wall biosynthesis